MTFNRLPVRMVEIDVDFCSLSFGVGGCPASLSSPPKNLFQFVENNDAPQESNWTPTTGATKTNEPGTFLGKFSKAVRVSGTTAFSRIRPGGNPHEPGLYRAILWVKVGTSPSIRATFTATENVAHTNITLSTGAATFSNSTNIILSNVTRTELDDDVLQISVDATIDTTLANLEVGIGPNSTTGQDVVVVAVDLVSPSGSERKCHNTFPTCSAKPYFSPAPLTLRFAEPRTDLPAGGPITFPVLDNVTPVTATVNIAGTNERFNGLGRRGTITATLTDFPYNDRVTDKYAAERKTGDAQLDEPGYDPAERGSFFAKLKARWPTYGDRAMRYIEGYIDEEGDLQVEITRHYIITDIKGPDRSGEVRIEGKDILHLADDKKALCPKPSRGQLRFEILERDNPLYTPVVEITPEGIGDLEYPSEGWATIGREVVTFTRSGDLLTLTGRGLENTQESSHREGSTVQLAYRVVNTRIDDLVEDLLVNFSSVPSTFIPKAKWEADVTRWASTLVLDTIITKPEGVQKLIAELAVIGVSVWWDDVEQEIGLKINSPVFDSDIIDLEDDSHILDIHQEDHDEDRLTQVHFYSVQTDPTGSATDKANFDRIIVAIDAEAEQENSYRNPRIREIFCRWVNRGADSVLLVNALRMLARFNTAPVTYKIKIDNKDNDISLVDVVRLNTRVNQDVTGKVKSRLGQVRQKSTRREVGWTDIEVQDFFFEGQFRVIAPNDTPVYGDATQEQKDTLAFMIAEGEAFFPDGAPAHQLI